MSGRRCPPNLNRGGFLHREIAPLIVLQICGKNLLAKCYATLWGSFQSGVVQLIQRGSLRTNKTAQSGAEDARGRYGFPMFSRDGKKLVFGSNRGAAKPGETNIFMADWKQ